MLSIEEKTRIRAEEIYRKEIRESLDKSNKNLFVSFLDTQHGVFISSTILLPLFMWLFSSIQNSYAEKQSTNNYIEKLDSEITFRVSNNYRNIEQGSLSFFKNQVNRVYAFPQFSGVHIQGLLLELEKVVPQEQKKDIARARQSLISGSESEVLQNFMIRGWYKE